MWDRRRGDERRRQFLIGAHHHGSLRLSLGELYLVDYELIFRWQMALLVAPCYEHALSLKQVEFFMSNSTLPEHSNWDFVLMGTNLKIPFLSIIFPPLLCPLKMAKMGRLLCSNLGRPIVRGGFYPLNCPSNASDGRPSEPAITFTFTVAIGSQEELFNNRQSPQPN